MTQSNASPDSQKIPSPRTQQVPPCPARPVVFRDWAAI